MADVNAILSERGARYGTFVGHAKITQDLKSAMYEHQNWAGLPDDVKESLEMIVHKIGRIVNGDPEYPDSWDDISGYAKLVSDRIAGVVR